MEMIFGTEMSSRKMSVIVKYPADKSAKEIMKFVAIINNNIQKKNHYFKYRNKIQITVKTTEYSVVILTKC